MCGFCGFTGQVVDWQQGREEVLTRMMNKIIHRGPDDAGSFLDEGAALGFRRLSIIDLDSGRQPMFNEDETLAVVFNGEIYNYQTLREELLEKGHVFRTHSDTEVLLHGYEEWGDELPNRLRGMFAFVIWNTVTQEIFAVRDFFGIKPFYYAVVNGNLVFGSEIKSILEYPDYVREVNPLALENYLTFQYSVLTETFFKGIYKLMPSHYLKFKDGKATVTRYWQPTFAPEEQTLDSAVEKIDRAMQNSIKAHKISDVEVGSFLSSGVDSSYVAACFQGDKTFTVGFDYAKYNEIDYAKALSEKVGIDNYSKLISTQEYWDAIPKVQYQMDEPLADASAIALYFVSQTAAKHVKVALSGEGADEFFGGYNIYREPEALRPITRLPRPVRKALGAVARAIPFHIKGKNYLIRGSKDLNERFIGNAFRFTEEERAKILKHPTGKYPHTQLTGPFYKQVQNLDPVTQMQYIDIHFWLIGDILLKADKMSMAHSLEVRVPFLDKEVFAVARTLPSQYKVAPQNTKYAMRLAAHRYLPDMVAEKKKLGFPVPIRIWLREDAYYNRLKAAFTSPAAAEYFNTAEIVRLLDEHKAGQADNSTKLWTVYMFLVWYDQYFAVA